MNIRKVAYEKYVEDIPELQKAVSSFRSDLVKTPEGERMLSQLEISLTRKLALQNVNQALGTNFGAVLTVANDNAEALHEPLPSNIAAFVEPENNFEGFFNETTLDLPQDKINKVGIHERIHQTTKITDIDLEKKQEAEEKKMSPEEKAALCEALGVKDINDTEINEGFTQALANREGGADEMIAYNAHEVPLVEKLEALAQEKIQTSLFELYITKDKAGLLLGLKKLSRKLVLEKLIKENTDKAIQENPELDQKALNKLLDENLAREKNVLEKTPSKNLKETLEKIIEQSIEQINLQTFLQAA